MTELGVEEKCEDCTEHDGEHCDNCLSDHYGHAVAEWHPACSSFVAEQPPEPPLCKKCRIEYVEEKGDICHECKKKKPWLY